MLKISDLKKSFDNNEVLKGVNLEISSGESVVIVGPSGGGKTTLLRCINALEKCDSGSISIDNTYLCNNGKYMNKKELLSLRRDIGLVFQNFNLFPHMSVLENLIEAPIKVLKMNKDEAIKKAKETLSFLGLEDKCNNYPCELSGGQKQRVAIGRALALEPKVLCFDEPTSALDPELTLEVAKIIKDLSVKGIAILIITHDMDFAKVAGDRIVSMNKGQIINEHIFQ